MSETATTAAPPREKTIRQPKQPQLPEQAPQAAGEPPASLPASSPPASSPTPPPVAAQDAPAPPAITWDFRGLWTVLPQPLTLNTNGKLPTLDVRLRGDRWEAPRTEHLRADFMASMQQETIASLLGCDEYRRVAELQPQMLHAQGALQAAQGRLTSLEGEKAALRAALPVPRNLAHSLHALDEKMRETRQEIQAARQTLETLSPIYEAARATLALRVSADARACIEMAWERGLAGVLTLLAPLQEHLNVLVQAWYHHRTVSSLHLGEMTGRTTEAVLREMGLDDVRMAPEVVADENEE